MTEYFCETIHDPIHGEISMSKLAIKIIDHPYFERMHYIFQTGMAYRIFPSATHSRKLHSIGTYGLTQRLLNILSKTTVISNRKKELICIGALCHDIGHCPGSHIFDKHVVQKLIKDGHIGSDHEWNEHEYRSIAIFREITKQLDLDLTPEEVDFICNVIYPPQDLDGWEYSIVNNINHGIDTDKLDYIVRDNYTIGLKLNIDINKIITQSKIIDNKWVFSSTIQDEIFNVYFVRYRLYRYIYNHPKIVSFDLLFRDIIMETPELYKKLVDIFINKSIDELCDWTDAYVLLNGSKETKYKFNQRNGCSLVQNNMKHTEFQENIPLHIKICKVTKNSDKSVPFYDFNTNLPCNIKDEFLWNSLPTEEYLHYRFIMN